MFQRLATALVLTLATLPVNAEPNLAALNQAVVNQHVLPMVARFQASAERLHTTASQNCDADSPDLIAAFHAAFDDWTRMSHLRFGPTETEDRAFAIAFWPDSRGKTPKALVTLLKGEDTSFSDPDEFEKTTIAARGLYALEFLLFDTQVQSAGDADTSCQLVQAITLDTARNAAGIAEDWKTYANLLLKPAETGIYRNETEATQELYKALATGLQFTSDTRLGRPLGTFDRPRPKRAELRRSGRSLQQIRMSLEGTRDIALILSTDTPEIRKKLESLYSTAFNHIDNLDDPVFAGVADVQGRLRVEIVQISITEIREVIALELGPALGVAAGFNALDGD